MSERRSATFGEVTVRSDGDQPIKFRGLAATFNNRTWIGPEEWGFFEEIKPGAFDRTLTAGADVRFLGEHDPGRLLARTTNDSLRLTTNRKGLVVDADIVPTSYARDMALLMGSGVLNEMSFAFTIPDGGDSWSRTKDGKEVRTITDVDLHDVAVVAFPAYAGTEAALRTVEARRAEHRTQTYEQLRARLEAAKKGW